MQKLHLLAGASVLAVTAIAGVASATTPVTQLYGAGSSLAAPYARQSGDCFGVQQTNAGLTNQFGTDTGYLVQQKNSGGTIITPTIIGVTAFNYTGTPAQNCASKQNTTATEFEYMSTGSGTGIKGVYSHDAQNQWGPVDGSGAVYWPAVYFGMSDNPLGAADVGVYNSGGTEQGISFGPGGAYATPSTLYGPLIQYPFIIDPVVFAYEPTYKRVVAADGSSHTDYHFNNHYPRTDGSGGLHLDSATYCQIFNGQITNWNAAALKTLNGKISLEDPTDPTPPASWSVPLQIVGRNDSSGTTSIFYRHLSTVCTEAGNQFASTTAVPSTLPAALRGPHWLKANAPYGANNGGIVDVPGEFTLADGNDGVAKYLGAFADASTLGSAEGGTNGTLNDGQTIILGRLGYVGPDFALPYVTNTGANSYGLNTASPKNAGGKFIEATPKAATASFANAPPARAAIRASCALIRRIGCKRRRLAFLWPIRLGAGPIRSSGRHRS